MTLTEYQAFYAKAQRPTLKELALWEFRCWVEAEAEENWWRVKFEAGKIMVSLAMGGLTIWVLS